MNLIKYIYLPTTYMYISVYLSIYYKCVSILEKGMATHSSILAWRIPWTEEPGGLQSTGLQRVEHD